MRLVVIGVIGGAEVLPGVYGGYELFIPMHKSINLPLVMSCDATSGTSSAKTAAKPLG